MAGFFFVLGLLGVLWGLQELQRREPRFVVGFFLVLPLLLTPYWARVYHTDLFHWVKIFSVIAGVLWFTALRYTRLGQKRWAYYGVLFILAANILEAVLQDLSGGHLAHDLNATAGILLIVTLFERLDTIQVNTGTRIRDLEWGSMTLLWVIAYTLWNWTFVFLQYPWNAGKHIAVLGAALLVGLQDPKRWLQARAFTLGTYLIFLFSFPTFIEAAADTRAWSTPTTELLAAGITLAVTLLYALGFAFRHLPVTCPIRRRLESLGTSQPRTANE